ncbi:MAG: bifunctional folylpolyglutamate synthase/dihydrofolate synthase [Anaerolineaceae bacterium]|nr:MAG: bifunctional folylpolyglutamate synthase/dihydrofolate synthase [Anaerolineaceae bacterium]
MTYDEAMRFIKQAEKLGSIPGLETIRNLLERLSNPQNDLKIIHVAGTNGKGSTISFLSGILACSNYKVGIYISPVVFSYLEKIQIVTLVRHINDSNTNNNEYINDNLNTNNILLMEYISEEDVCQSLEAIKSACDDMVLEGLAHPTAFEIETAMAFLYLKKEQVDFLILETGMGGRQDATNVINSPICSLITPVSLDHVQFLGNTLEQIAYEKAGIIKGNSCVITARQAPEVLSVFSKKADELDIPIIMADTSKAANIRYYDNFTTFEYPEYKSEKYKINMLGRYQVQNAILAITSARWLRSIGYNISDEAIRKGLYLTKWQGRFEHISQTPDIYIDGAHNEEAALSLRNSIEIYFTNRRLIFMIGVLADKDYKSILRILAPMADTIITLKPNNQRGLASDRLADEARLYCNKVFDEKDIEHAINRAYTEAGRGDVILAFGSLSFLGGLVSTLRVRKDERNG